MPGQIEAGTGTLPGQIEAGTGLRKLYTSLGYQFEYCIRLVFLGYTITLSISE